MTSPRAPAAVPAAARSTWARLAELARRQPDATLVELRDRLGVKVRAWAVGKEARGLGLTYKKSFRAAEQAARTRGSGPSGV